MGYTPVTPFRRTVDAAVMKHQALGRAALPPGGANKWEILRELSAARETYDLSDRDMAVLQALISFHQGNMLGGQAGDLVVHPSNKAICERLNGMPNSTMRRHLARLVETGVIIRRDSPNGKRYARRYGDDKIAYGFDLAPLLHRFAEFCENAERVRALTARQKRLRETVSLMRRDLAGLAEYGASLRPDLGLWDAFADLATLTARDLRRKLTLDDLGALEARLGAALDQARDLLEPPVSAEMSTNDAPYEQHYQSSDKDSYESEQPVEDAPASSASPDPTATAKVTWLPDRNRPNLPLSLVLETCRELQTYAQGDLRHWHDFVRAADLVRPMMGISPPVWDEAKRVMGPEQAAVVLAAMLERFADIQSHGAYLRHLTSKAEAGAFSCGPMVMALRRRDAA